MTKQKGFIELFTEGAYNGLQIGLRNMMPNVILAFIIIHALKITGLLDWIGSVAVWSWRFGFCRGWRLPLSWPAAEYGRRHRRHGGVVDGSGALTPYEATVLFRPAT